MATIKDLIENMNKGKAEERAEKKKEIEAEKLLLQDLASKIEASGNKATDNAQYNEQALKIQKDELALRKSGTTSKAAQEEIAKEEAAIRAKDTSILGKIANGISGIVQSGKDAAAKAGGGLKSLLKGTLFAGLFFAIAEFLQSPTFAKVAKFIGEKIIPPLKTFYNEVILPAFTAVVDFLMNDAFPAIGKFLDKTLIPLLKSTYENVIKPAFEAIKNFVTNNVFPALEQIFAKLKETYEKIKPSLDALFTFLKETTLPVLMDTLKKLFKNFKDIIVNIIDFVGNIISGDFGKAFDNLKDIGGLIVEAIDNAITGVLKMVGIDFEGNVSDVIGRFFDNIFNSISNAITGVIQGIENFVRALPGGDTIADSIFGEQTEEEKALIAQKKKEAELAEQQAKRQEQILTNLKKKAELEEKIAEEQAKITRVQEGVTTAREEFGIMGSQRVSEATIKRAELELSKLEKRNESLGLAQQETQSRFGADQMRMGRGGPTTNQLVADKQEGQTMGIFAKRAEIARKRRAKIAEEIQQRKIDEKMRSASMAMREPVINAPNTTVNSSQSNSSVSSTSFIGNPDLAFKLAAASSGT